MMLVSPHMLPTRGAIPCIMIYQMLPSCTLNPQIILLDVPVKMPAKWELGLEAKIQRLHINQGLAICRDGSEAWASSKQKGEALNGLICKSAIACYCSSIDPISDPARTPVCAACSLSFSLFLWQRQGSSCVHTCTVQAHARVSIHPSWVCLCICFFSFWKRELWECAHDESTGRPSGCSTPE